MWNTVGAAYCGRKIPRWLPLYVPMGEVDSWSWHRSFVLTLSLRWSYFAVTFFPCIVYIAWWTWTMMSKMRVGLNDRYIDTWLWMDFVATCLLHFVLELNLNRGIECVVALNSDCDYAKDYVWSLNNTFERFSLLMYCWCDVSKLKQWRKMRLL